MEPGVWAIYIVGILGFGGTIWSIRANFKLKNKADTFDTLSTEIREASNLMRLISSDAEAVINALAEAANNAAQFDYQAQDESAIEEEIQKRISTLQELQGRYYKHSEKINESAVKILGIIKNIEKSTIVKNKTRISARYVYYAYLDQLDLMKVSSELIETIQVVPLIGEMPNVTPETFNAMKKLIMTIHDRNTSISGFIDDLERVLHNDLVKKIYGRSRGEAMPDKRLSSKGIRDKRVNSPLL